MFSSTDATKYQFEFCRLQICCCCAFSNKKLLLFEVILFGVVSRLQSPSFSATGAFKVSSLGKFGFLNAKKMNFTRALLATPFVQFRDATSQEA